jgi:FKBP-type peptidyl-prolyl cis-trans isomerase FkpA
MRNLLAFCALAVAGLAACDNNAEGQTQTTESGLSYTILRKGEGPKPDSGQVMAMHMVYTTGSDSVLFDSREQGMPIGFPYQDPQFQGMFAEGMNLLEKGDSAQFLIPAQNFFYQTAKVPVPFGIDAEDTMKFNLVVLDVMSQEDFMDMQRKSAEEKQKVQVEKDAKIIEEHLSSNNIEAQKTESGLFYVIEEEGSGEQVQAGDSVTVHYRGQLLDGTPFDASYDRNEPFTFVVGRGQVIRGWDEGLQLLKKGGKATLYIPSSMAYGPRQMGPVIAPNSILKFEVEVLDIK